MEKNNLLPVFIKDKKISEIELKKINQIFYKTGSKLKNIKDYSKRLEIITDSIEEIFSVMKKKKIKKRIIKRTKKYKKSKKWKN